MTYNPHTAKHSEFLEAFSNLSPVDQQKALNYMRALTQKEGQGTWERYHDLIWHNDNPIKE
jgi:hypothetical protein